MHHFQLQHWCLSINLNGEVTWQARELFQAMCVCDAKVWGFHEEFKDVCWHIEDLFNVHCAAKPGHNMPFKDVFRLAMKLNSCPAQRLIQAMKCSHKMEKNFRKSIRLNRFRGDTGQIWASCKNYLAALLFHPPWLVSQTNPRRLLVPSAMCTSPEAETKLTMRTISYAWHMKEKIYNHKKYTRIQ